MPDISKITLPSGTTYDIKDTVARQAIAGGVSFIVAWDGASTPVPADIPAGVQVTYGGTTYTGTLAAADAQAGAFYLISTGDSGNNIYEEYVPVEVGSTKSWEMIGTTKVSLTGLVTDVTLVPQTTNFVTALGTPTTANVIGADATFTVTQPTITVTPDQTYIGATASGTAVSASGDEVTVVTGYASPTTDTFVKSVTAETNKKLDTSTVTGVTGSTTASKATADTAQTTANGSGTASQANTDWLKGVSVSNETLVIGAATMDTQTTTQFTFADVTVPVADASATTVATGTTSTSGSGDAIVTGVTVGDSAAAITALGTASTDTVLGSASSFTVTQPTISLDTGASGTGKVQVATGISSATATNGAVAFDSKDQKAVVTDLGTATTAAGLNDTTDITVTKHA